MSFDRASGTRQAAQLSFFVLMTFPALLLLAVWVLSNVFDTPNVREDLIKFIIDNLPVEEVEGRQEITKFLNGLTRGAGSLGILTVGVLLYSGSAAMGAMRHAVETANENSADGPSFPKNKGLDILITAVTLPFALVFVALIVSRPVNSAIDDDTFFSTWSPPPSADRVGIFAFGVLFFTWMFWVLNPGKTPWASTLIGAATAATLVGAGVLRAPVLVRHLRREQCGLRRADRLHRPADLPQPRLDGGRLRRPHRGHLQAETSDWRSPAFSSRSVDQRQDPILICRFCPWVAS